MKRHLPVIVVGVFAAIMICGLICWKASLDRSSGAFTAAPRVVDDVGLPPSVAETPAVPEPVAAATADRHSEAAESAEPSEPRPLKGDRGRMTNGYIVKAKNPDPIQLARDAWLQFGDECYLAETTVVIVGFLDQEILVRALEASPEYDNGGGDPLLGCPAGTLFLIAGDDWPTLVEEQATFEASQKEIEAEKEMIRRLLRQEKRQLVEQE